MQGAETVLPVGQRLKGFIVLAGIDKAAVDQGIRGEDRRVGAGDVLLEPVPDAVRGALIVPAGEHIRRRGEDGITCPFCRISRVGEADRTVVLRDKNDRFGRGSGTGENQSGKSGGCQKLIPFHDKTSSG